MHKEDNYFMKFFDHIFNKHSPIAISILIILAVVVLMRVFAATPYAPSATLDPATGPGDSFVQTQWTNSGNDISNTNSGNVGIGTATPAGKLDVEGTNGTNFVLTDSPGNVNLQYTTDNGAFGQEDLLITPGYAELAINGETRGIFIQNTGGNNFVKVQSPPLYFTADVNTGFFSLIGGNVGIGTSLPASMFSVGASNQFQVNSTGDIVKLNGATTTFPSVNASGVLTNDGSGTLTWAASSSGWSLAGNTLTGTLPGSPTEFLGSTNNADLVFKVNNEKAGKLSSVSPTFFGYKAGNVSTGLSNTGFGFQALLVNTFGTSNTAIGNNALNATTSGNNNTALGNGAGVTLVVGNAVTTGNNNTFIGLRAGPGTSTQLNNATAIGAAAVVSASDSLVLGSINGVNGATADTFVGIGTAIPSFPLDIASSGAGVLTLGRIQNTVAAANDSGAKLLFAANRTTSGLTDVAGIAGIITDITDTPYRGALAFYTANNAAPAERMRIGQIGVGGSVGVGIGNTSPATRLDVTNETPGGGIIVRAIAAGNSPAISLLNSSGGLLGRLCGSLGIGQCAPTDVSGEFSIQSGAGPMLFTTGALLTERMRITSTGNVGIGASVPTALFHLKDGHIRSEQTTAPTIVVTTGNGITAAAITAGSTDTKGNITTTGTNNNGGATELTITFNTAYTVAPTVVITAANASGAIEANFATSTTTTFTLFLASMAGAGADPSYNYHVIE